ncbi:CDP-diacylglycerol--glycerol-3-phosphate 3-phosphatidyltransferase [Cochlodiniinecator piscidefendens]|uniref:CDP-diacylglycerol--glycerol-3-phosphate 3-phosphatidyltransferase n=1 Tax=Cochlodiniinecator piscidefendens TaxID=2715756 RepID=UPI0014089AE5|nr:CDP-diacylglycerol--glycerol-3-phosphate 3-phosphatidyltransferase [Cochlodiniinecator piscidefendens]
MIWNLPNILTVFRLLAAPGVAVMFLYFSRPWADWFALSLFAFAAITDFVDGYLARAWKQESKFGAMLDPIADKAMVIIALLILTAYSSQNGANPMVLIPAVAIMFREVFVSGLREFLGDKAGLLKVTNLAKWKTTVQMVAIAVLFAFGVFEHYFVMQSYGMNQEIVGAVLSGETEDHLGLIWKYNGMYYSYYGGTILLWLAGALTLITGWDYFAKAMPMLKEDPKP